MGLGNLFKRQKKKEASPILTQSLSPSIEQSILNSVGARSIPPMSGTAQRAFQLSTSPQAQLDEFVDLIESDESLSARVLKIANSVYYDRGKKTETIPEAVVVIGMNELKSILSSSTLSDLFPSTYPERALLWSHDIAVAIAARTIAQQTNPSVASFVFLAGLMHDIGKLLLLQRCPDIYKEIIGTVERTGRPYIEVEAEAFPFDHTEVGLLIAQKWSFPSDISEIIRFHHASIEELKEQPQTLIIHTADLIAHALNLGREGKNSRLQDYAKEHLDSALSATGVDLTRKKDLLNEIQRNFDIEYQTLLDLRGK